MELKGERAPRSPKGSAKIRRKMLSRATLALELASSLCLEDRAEYNKMKDSKRRQRMQHPINKASLYLSPNLPFLGVCEISGGSWLPINTLDGSTGMITFLPSPIVLNNILSFHETV